MIRLRPPIEANARQNRPELSHRRTEPMGLSANARREDLTGDDERGSVGPEVEEELCNDDAGKAAAGGEARTAAGEDAEHQGRDEEALDLNPLAAEQLDEGDGDEVARDVAGNGDDEVALCVLEEVLIGRFAGRVAYVGENDGLVEIDSVEGDVDEEPGEGASEEGQGVARLAEVLDEDGHLRSLCCLSSWCCAKDMAWHSRLCIAILYFCFLLQVNRSDRFG